MLAKRSGFLQGAGILAAGSWGAWATMHDSMQQCSATETAKLVLAITSSVFGLTVMLAIGGETCRAKNTELQATLDDMTMQLRQEEMPEPPTRYELHGDAEAAMLDDDLYQHTVENLAVRGFTLDSLLEFYSMLLERSVMSHFDPNISSTNDVVMQVIIPLSKEKRCAYRDIMMDGKPAYANVMVSHNWENVFSHLVAALVADAMSLPSYAVIVPQLRTPERLQRLRADLQANHPRGLQRTYWVCAFNVNQHASMCQRASYIDVQTSGQEMDRLNLADSLKMQDSILQPSSNINFECGTTVPKNAKLGWIDGEAVRSIEDLKAKGSCTLRFYFSVDRVTGLPFEGCTCGMDKLPSGNPRCEMDKFDVMMEHLSSKLGNNFCQLVALDEQGAAITRAWVVAEVNVGFNVPLRQKTVVFWPPQISSALFKERAASIDVRQCQASRIEDKEMILSKIPDPEELNHNVRTVFENTLNVSGTYWELLAVVFLVAGLFLIPINTYKGSALLLSSALPLLALARVFARYGRIIGKNGLLANVQDEAVKAEVFDEIPRLWWSSWYISLVRKVGPVPAELLSVTLPLSVITVPIILAWPDPNIQHGLSGLVHPDFWQ